MIKSLKSIFVLFLAVCLTVTSIALTACKDDKGDPAEDGYTVEVLYHDNKPVKPTDSGDNRRQVSATLLDDEGKQLNKEDGTPLGYVRLNNEGKAHFDYYVPGAYRISLINLPAGYTYDENAKTSAKEAETTVKIEPIRNMEYEISVTLPDGTPASNVSVKLMDGRKEVASMITNANGAAKSAKIDAGAYDVILNIPSDYCYKPVKTSKVDNKVSIRLSDLNVIDLQEKDKMPKETVDEWATSLNFKDYVRFDPELTHYLYTADIKGNEEVFYVFKVEKAGKYTITVNNDPNYEIKFYPGSLAEHEKNLTLKTGNGTGVQSINLKTDDVFYLSVCTLDGNAHAVQFAVTFNIEPATVTATKPGNYTLNYELNYAILQFKPSESGIYSIETKTDVYDTKLLVYSQANNKPLIGEDGKEIGNDDKSETDKNCYYEEEVRSDHIGNTYIFRIYIKDDDVEMPVSINAVITRVGDAKNFTTSTRNVTTTNDKVFDNQEGTLTEVPTDGSAQISEENGLWYIEVGGVKHKLVASIKRNLPGVEYSFATVEYMGESRPGEGNDSDEKVPVNSKLTLFVDEVETETAITRNYANYRDFIAAYSKLCNKDGVYELNSEIRDFLVHYLDRTSGGFDIANFAGLSVAKGCYWLLACGYYA